jgi:hypothetical protein
MLSWEELSSPLKKPPFLVSVFAVYLGNGEVDGCKKEFFNGLFGA